MQVEQGDFGHQPLDLVWRKGLSVDGQVVNQALEILCTHVVAANSCLARRSRERRIAGYGQCVTIQVELPRAILPHRRYVLPDADRQLDVGFSEAHTAVEDL